MTDPSAPRHEGARLAGIEAAWRAPSPYGEASRLPAPPTPTPPKGLLSRRMGAGAGLLPAARVVTALVVMALAFLTYQRRELQAAALERSELFARVLEEQVSRTLNGVEWVLGSSAEALRGELISPTSATSPAHPAGPTSPSAAPRLALPLQTTLRALPSLRSISRVDAQGRVLASSNAANIGRQLVRQRLLAPGVSAGLGLLQSGADLADLDIEPVGAASPAESARPGAAHFLPMVRPVDPTAESDWLVAVIDPGEFAILIRRLLDGTPQRAALLAGDGQLIAASERIALAVGSRAPDHRVFSQLQPGREQGRFIGPGLDGPTAYTAYTATRTVRAAPLVVLVETPGAPVADQFWAVAQAVAGGTGAMLLVLGVLASLARRSLRGREQASGDLAATQASLAAQRTAEGLQAAERANAANAAKTEFLANISHELRTPLQSILGFSELGGTRSRSDAQLHGMFGDIHAAGERMLLLVNNLLDLSRLESTVGEVVLRPIDITPGLRSVVAELWQLAQARGLRLVISAHLAPGAGLWANADEFRLQQVLRNLLANAIRFAPPGSEISVMWQHDGPDALQVQVRDHGPGIPSDELGSIFEPFVQSSRTKDGSGGTGLGLAICRKIMAAHHGHISVRNHPEGGAVFEFSLPAVAAVAAQEGAAQNSNPPASAALK